mmetsp:Transcript_72726/g.229091  ORF Transcript_72726/g.229091 Transcript_72726/m.229091 type:complete len:216 (-) Transcript_72726:431-1078(-)
MSAYRARNHGSSVDMIRRGSVRSASKCAPCFANFPSVSRHVSSPRGGPSTHRADPSTAQNTTSSNSSVSMWHMDTPSPRAGPSTNAPTLFPGKDITASRAILKMFPGLASTSVTPSSSLRASFVCKPRARRSIARPLRLKTLAIASAATLCAPATTRASSSAASAAAASARTSLGAISGPPTLRSAAGLYPCSATSRRISLMDSRHRRRNARAGG